MPSPTRDYAGPNPERLAPDSGAEYRQHRLLEEVGRRPHRPRLQPVQAASADPLCCPRTSAIAAARARLEAGQPQEVFDELVTSEAFTSLRDGVQRVLLSLMRSTPVLAATKRYVPALAGADRQTQSAMLEVFEVVAPRPSVMDVVVRWAASPLFAALDGPDRRRALRLLSGPTASPHSWTGRQATLDDWWLRVTQDAEEAWGPDVHIARSAWRSFVFEPRMPVFFMKSDAFPGVALVVVGSPDDPNALAYARVFFLDEQDRLQVGLKSPVEPIRGGWSPKVDPKGVRYEFRRADLNLAEALAFIRWVEGNHSVSGAHGLHTPALSQRAIYDGLIQFDLRAPRIVETLGAHRGPLEWVEGEMVRGKVVRLPKRAA